MARICYICGTILILAIFECQKYQKSKERNYGRKYQRAGKNPEKSIKGR